MNGKKFGDFFRRLMFLEKVKHFVLETQLAFDAISTRKDNLRLI